MTSFDDAVSAVQKHSAAFQSALRSWPAYLGDGDGNVIGSQVNYYHCRYPTPESPAIEVYANGCPPNDGLRVMVGTTADQPNLIQIVSWNDSVLDDTVNDHVKNHGEQHAYLGGDTVWVDWRQIMTFRVQPYSGLTVYVNGGVLPRSGADLQIIPQIIDLTSSVPGSSGQSRYALLSINTVGEIVVTDGSIVTPVMALDASDVPNTPAGNFRIAAVALQYGQTLITESLLQRDILDLRWPQESMAGSGVITPAMLANASAQYKYLVSGSTPFSYAESAGALNISSGKTLTVPASITVTGTDGKTATLTGSLTIGADTSITGGGTIALGGFTATIPETLMVAGRNVDNSFTADNYFTGAGSGLPYGSCWGNEIGWSQASAAQNTWYVISDTDMTDGQLNLVTHDGSGKLTVTKAGVYYVVYTVSQTNNGNNKHVQTGIAINGTVQNDGVNHVDGLAANIDTVLSGNAILALTASQYIEIAIRTTDTGTPTISVDHLNVTIFQVGG